MENSLDIVECFFPAGGLFSATAGPLLPDNLAFKSFNKMWRSTSREDLPSPQGEDSQPPASLQSPVRSQPRLRKQSSFDHVATGEEIEESEAGPMSLNYSPSEEQR